MVTVRNRSGHVVTVSSPAHVAVFEQLIRKGEVERVEPEKPRRAKGTAPKPASE